MDKDLKNSVNGFIAVNIQAISTDTTTAGTAIDLGDIAEEYGYESLTFVLLTGVRSAGTATILVEDSDDDSTYIAVSNDFLIGTEGTLNAANSFSIVGYNGKKRYVKASIVSATSANLTAGVLAILGDKTSQPV